MLRSPVHLNAIMPAKSQFWYPPLPALETHQPKSQAGHNALQRPGIASNPLSAGISTVTATPFVADPNTYVNSVFLSTKPSTAFSSS
jgi:hypothetical protein